MANDDARSGIVVLTGAGISAESGVPTFRDANGLWEGHDVMDVATPEGFARDPALVQRFYDQRRAALADVEPNAAHRALARLQREHDARVTLVTQNVDDLHERAGAEVLHMHGELRRARCLDCARVHRRLEPIGTDGRCPDCDGGLRPHVVWFGEVPLGLERIGEALADAGVFVAIGTSGEVYPAAGFVHEARAVGARTVEINLAPSAGGGFDEVRTGRATREVVAWVDEVLAGR